MPGVKFTIDADASAGVRAMDGLAAAERRADQGMERLAKSARASEAAVEGVAKAGRKVAEYDLAPAGGARRNPAIPLPRAAGERYVRPGRGGAFDLAPVTRGGSSSPAIAAPADGGAYELVRTEEERFARWAKAQDLKAARRAERLRRINNIFRGGSADFPDAHASRLGAEAAAAQVREEAGARHTAEGQRMLRDFEDRQAGRFNYGRRSDYQLLRAYRGGERSEATHDAYVRTAGQLVTAASSPGLKDVVGTVGMAGAVVGAAVLAFDRHFESVAQTLDRVGKAGAAFEGEMTPLLSLGTNLGHAGQIKDRVLGMSGAYGMERAEVAKALFSLQSGTGNLDAKTRDQLLGGGVGLTATAGGNLETNLTALVKTYQVYGKEIGSVDRAQAKLFKTAEQGYLTFDDMAQLLPDILPAAKAVGYSFDDVAGALITATQVGGRNERTFTGVRNTFLNMHKALEAGLIPATGTFAEQMAALQKNADGVKLQELFGNDAITTVAALAQKSGELAGNIRQVAEVTGNENLQKFLDKMSSAEARDAANTKGVEQDLANVDVIRAKDGSLRDDEERLKLTKLGYKSTVSATTDAATPQALENLRLWFSMKRDDSENDFLQVGLQHRIGDLQKAGDKQSLFQANLLRVKYGEATGQYVTDAQGNKRYTDGEDAQRYADVSARLGRDVGAKSFLQYDQLRETNPQAAEQFLQSLVAAAQQMQQAAKQQAAAADTQARTAQGVRNTAAHK